MPFSPMNISTGPPKPRSRDWRRRGERWRRPLRDSASLRPSWLSWRRLTRNYRFELHSNMPIVHKYVLRRGFVQCTVHCSYILAVKRLHTIPSVACFTVCIHPDLMHSFFSFHNCECSILPTPLHVHTYTYIQGWYFGSE